MSAPRITDMVGPISYLCIWDESSLTVAKAVKQRLAFTSLIGSFPKPVDPTVIPTISVSTRLAKFYPLIRCLEDGRVNGRIASPSAAPLINYYLRPIARPILSAAVGSQSARSNESDVGVVHDGCFLERQLFHRAVELDSRKKSFVGRKTCFS